VIDLDDIATVDPELADAISENCRRYTQLFAQVIQEMLPELKDKEVKFLFLKKKEHIDLFLDSK
jgi:DNA replication licensing factor MCM7